MHHHCLVVNEICIPDGVYKLKNTGSDLIGCRLGIAKDNVLLLNEEYLQSGETKLFIIGEQPSNSVLTTMPSLYPSTIPSRFPSILPSPSPIIKLEDLSTAPSVVPIIAPDKTPCEIVAQGNLCKENLGNLIIQHKSVWAEQLTIHTDKQLKWGFKNVKTIDNSPSGMLLICNMCMNKKKCYRLRIARKGKKTKGWYKFFFEGKY